MWSLCGLLNTTHTQLNSTMHENDKKTNDDFKCLVNAIMKKSVETAVTLPLSATYGTRVRDAFQLMFQSQANIEFVCSACKSTGTFKEICDKYEKNVIDANKKSDAAANKIVLLKQEHATEIETLTQQLPNVNAKIDELNNNANATQGNVCENFIGRLFVK